MTKIVGRLQRRVSSIFRKRKVAPKTKGDLDLVDVHKKPGSAEEASIKLEATETESEVSCSLDQAAFGALVEVLPKTKTKKKSVRFSQVTVRHYDLILGDNPYCRFPLSLGWNYAQTEQDIVGVDCFEEERAKRRALTAKERICPRLYVPPSSAPSYHCLRDVHMEQDYDDSTMIPAELTLYERRARLRAFGYTEAALRQAERQRIVALALQWKDGGTPRFPFPNKFITRYTK